ncbi:hypothetical protein, partial [Sutterella massiliensis]|uniref:hypothetical protein n=1 Tax=Sutterella massiliensis TaxID=1816689 RepID=UPI00195FFC11
LHGPFVIGIIENVFLSCIGIKNEAVRELNKVLVADAIMKIVRKMRRARENERQIAQSRMPFA